VSLAITKPTLTDNIELKYISGTITIDRGVQFESEEFSPLMMSFGIYQTRSSPYHRQAYEHAESLHCLLISALNALQTFPWTRQWSNILLTLVKAAMLGHSPTDLLVYCTNWCSIVGSFSVLNRHLRNTLCCLYRTSLICSPFN